MGWMLLIALQTSFALAQQPVQHNHQPHVTATSQGTYYDYPAIMLALTGPYDDSKKNQLSQLGLKNSSLIKNREGATIAEKYSNINGSVSILVSRNAASGMVTSIERTTRTQRGSVTVLWNLTQNNVAHSVRVGENLTTVEVSLFKCNPSFVDRVQNRNILKQDCPFIVQNNLNNSAPDRLPASESTSH